MRRSKIKTENKNSPTCLSAFNTEESCRVQGPQLNIDLRALCLLGISLAFLPKAVYHISELLVAASQCQLLLNLLTARCERHNPREPQLSRDISSRASSTVGALEDLCLSLVLLVTRTSVFFTRKLVSAQSCQTRSSRSPSVKELSRHFMACTS